MNSQNFLEMLHCNEEFVFKYNGNSYEIVYDNLGKFREVMLCLYLLSSETLIGVYNDQEDFLNNCILDGEKLSNITDKIIV